MRVYHNRSTGHAKIVIDDQPMVELHGLNLHRLVTELWHRGLVLGRTSHWTPDGDYHRHGLEPADDGPDATTTAPGRELTSGRS